MVHSVDERRNPRTAATVNQLLDRYLEMIDVSASTHVMYQRYLDSHVRPFIGTKKAGALGPDELDSLYAELRRCRVNRRPRSTTVDHRTPRVHECDERYRTHVCRPLSNTTIRHIHHVSSGAYERAVRWRWVAASPVVQADVPVATPPDPQPPTPKEAARLIEEASIDPDWGALVWFTMTTGAARYRDALPRPAALLGDRVDRGGDGHSHGGGAVSVMVAVGPRRCGSTRHGWRRRISARQRGSRVGCPRGPQRSWRRIALARPRVCPLRGWLLRSCGRSRRTRFRRANSLARSTGWPVSTRWVSARRTRRLSCCRPGERSRRSPEAGLWSLRSRRSSTRRWPLRRRRTNQLPRSRNACWTSSSAPRLRCRGLLRGGRSRRCGGAP
jgi:hypothetical protein